MDPLNELHLLGVSFRTAPVEVRESLSFTATEAAEFLKASAAETPSLEALILSTCNRTEFYLVASAGSQAAPAWLHRLRRLRPTAQILRSECLKYQLSGEEAARHAFRVACGLDSSVLGDVQILGQIKESLSVSIQSGTLGHTLNQTFQQAIRAGKKARSQTGIGQGAASIGSALAGMLLGRNSGRSPRILIIGAGEIARDIGRHLAKRRLGDLFFINRTPARACQAAALCGAGVLPWNELDSALLDADIVVAATACPAPILRKETLDELLSQRPSRPLWVIDAGAPRNVQPGSKAEVIGIDAIREQQQHVLALRQAAVPAVEAIVETEVAAWNQWRDSLPVESIIKQLYREAAAAGPLAARKLATRDDLLPDQVEQLFHATIKQLLHGHVRRLRRLPRNAMAGFNS